MTRPTAAPPRNCPLAEWLARQPRRRRYGLAANNHKKLRPAASRHRITGENGAH